MAKENQETVQTFHIDNLDAINGDDYVAVFAADLHLKNRIWKDRSDIEGDTYASLEQIAKICTTLNLPLILGGDNFDVPNPTSKDVIFLRKIVKTIGEVYGIDGNHDFATPSWLSVCDVENLDNRVVSINGKRIGGIRSYLKQESAELKQRLKNLDPMDFLIMHQLADFMLKPEFSNFHIEDLPSQINTCLLGDVHQHGTALNTKGTYFAYPGSIAPMSLAETDNKTVILMRKQTDTSPIDLVQLKTRKIINVVVKTEADYAHVNSNQFASTLNSHKESTGFKPVIRLHYHTALDDVSVGRSLAKIRSFLTDFACLFVHQIYEKSKSSREIEADTTSEEIISSFVLKDEDELTHGFITDIVTSPVPVQTQLSALRSKLELE